MPKNTPAAIMMITVETITSLKLLIRRLSQLSSREPVATY
jgi:hypothetical protein